MAALPGIATAAAQLGLDSIVVKPKRRIGPFKAQVTISEQHHEETQITDHPVEQGSVISDHAYMLPSTVTLSVMWSNSPSDSSVVDGLMRGVTGTFTGAKAATADVSSLNTVEMYDKLYKLQKARIPFDVYTGKRLYRNMLIQRMSVSTDKDTEQVLMATITCRQVIIANTQTVAVSAPQNKQLQPAATAATVNAGQQNLQPGTGFVAPGAGK